MNVISTRGDIPLFVDLDGTLIRTDVAQELLVRSIADPSKTRSMFSAALKGRAQLKHELAENQCFDVTTLPYNQVVIDYLIAEKAKGRRIVLATAADSAIANKVSEHLGLFDEVLSSRPGLNLKGQQKLEAILAICDGPFEYLGDSTADKPIWAAAKVAGIVNPKPGARAAVPAGTEISLDIADMPTIGRAVLKAMRPHQWAKNVLVFLPLFFAHGYTDITLVASAVLAFLFFCLFASSIYIINDLLDVEADRLHAKKRHRPFAAGHLQPIQGVIAATGLITGSIVLSLLLLPPAMTLIFLSYLIITTLYSTWLKHYATIDVITLTCLYTLRIFAGAVAIGATPSPWLLNFSLFFFLSLALMKRYIELVRVKKAGRSKSRGYFVSDVQAILPMGVATGGLAVLTLTLYLNSPYVAESYASPGLLWLMAPIVTYWIYRAWFWALRDKMDDDPVIFALRDKTSRATLALSSFLVICSKFLVIEVFHP